MKKNGFTLVELLGVIAILALLATVATPAIISLSNKIKGNMYDAKVKLIKETAILYAEKRGISGGTYRLNALCGECQLFKPEHLSAIGGYQNCGDLYRDYMMAPDKGLEENKEIAQCVKNPINNEPMGEKCYFKIEKENGRYKITFPVNKNGTTTNIDEACLK